MNEYNEYEEILDGCVRVITKKTFDVMMSSEKDIFMFEKLVDVYREYMREFLKDILEEQYRDIIIVENLENNTGWDNEDKHNERIQHFSKLLNKMCRVID